MISGSNTLRRAVSGAVYVLLVSGCILAGRYPFFILFSIIQLLCIFEFYRLAERDLAYPSRSSGMLTAFLFFVASALVVTGTAGPGIYFFPAGAVYLLFIFSLFSSRPRPFNDLAFTLLGVVYLGVPFVALNYLAFDEHDRYRPLILFCYVILVWLFDTFAYLAGSAFGRHKLYARISPGKTWEGIAGGALMVLAGSKLISLLEPGLPFYKWIIIGMLIVIAGTFGDLFKSLLKRNVGVKDSGVLIPGHGGMLDRFDSILFSAPFVVAFLHWK